MLFQRIREDIKKAMIEKNDIKKSILRVVIGEIQRKTGAESDEDVIKVIKKVIEGNDESMKVSPSTVLIEENNILKEYLPKFWTHQEIESFFLNHDDPIFESIRDAKSDGQATGIAMKALKCVNAPVDGKSVNEIVRKIRNG